MYWDEPGFRGPGGANWEQASDLGWETGDLFHGFKDRPGKIESRGSRLVRTRDSKTGTSWDHLPKMEVEILADGQVAVFMPPEKLAVFVGYLESALALAAPDNLKPDEEKFRWLFKHHSFREAEAVSEELWRAHGEPPDRPDQDEIEEA